MTPVNDVQTALGALVQALHARAHAHQQRETLLLAGAAHWCQSQAEQVCAVLNDCTPLWLGTDPREAERLLGAETTLLILNAHLGFDPDAFGMLSGTLRGGGLLVLLTPPLPDWPTRPDPQAERIAIWPWRPEQLTNRFITRLAHLLAHSDTVVRIEQGAHIPHLGVAPRAIEPRPQMHADQPATPDQARAIAAILSVARSRARRPLVISAHRGRGKSAALGLAAAELLASGSCQHITLTAPRRRAVAALFTHARARLGESAREDGSGLSWGACRLVFRAPEALLDAPPPPPELLLVDEAAAIPAPLLEQLLRTHPRVVFATTVHGYEGTGRGFEIRFRATLDRLTPAWRALSLETPIRWAADDPLEALSFRALLLDAAPAPAAMLASGQRRCTRVNRAALAADEPMLRQLFGLLVLAHYQTRPMDLRMLLDGPGVRIYVVRIGAAVAATLVASAEGGLHDAGLCAEIFAGRRRPRGHLLPQTLSAHGGLERAPMLRMLRVVRIATHPARVRHGLGAQLLRQLEQNARAEGFDALGASFGASPELLAFWRHCGYQPVQLGTSRNGASGEHAVVVLRGLTPEAQALEAQARARFSAHVPVLLAGPLRALDAHIAFAILCTLPPDLSLNDALSVRELRGFAEAQRPFEASLPALALLGRVRLAPAWRAARISTADGALWVAATLQLRPMAELVRLSQLSGRQALIKRLRAVACVLMGADCRQEHPAVPTC